MINNSRSKGIINHILIIIFLVTGSIIWYSCLFGEDGIKVDLYEKKILSDTTIVISDSLNLDLTEYFELIKSTTYDKYGGHPDIIPDIADTSIAHINYNYKIDNIGKNFSILGVKEGITAVILNLSWMDCDNTIWSEAERIFNLSVVDE